jgi:hypothetical protein
VVEQRARGVYHGVDGSSPRVMDIAAACSRAAGKLGATRSVAVAEARKAMGAVADALCLDQVVRARHSAELGWRPEHRPLMESVESVWREFRG